MAVEPQQGKVMREPAEMVSDAFLMHTYRRKELSDFNEYYHRLAAQAIKPGSDETNEELLKEYRGQGIFYLENYIIRISDLFDIYLEHLIFAVALESPTFLPEKMCQRAKALLIRLGVPDPTEEDILNEAAVSLARKDKTEIVQHFRDKTGFDLTLASPFWGNVIIFSKIRNLIVHKASRIDERFVESARNQNFPFNVELGCDLLMPERWIMELASSIDSCIYAIDDAISDFIAIHKRNRYGHFWLARSTSAEQILGQSSLKSSDPSR